MSDDSIHAGGRTFRMVEATDLKEQQPLRKLYLELVEGVDLSSAVCG